MSVHFININGGRCRSKSKKSLRPRLERIFDKLYAEAERVLRSHRPCKVAVNQHGASCLDCRNGHASKVNVMCCGSCKWHTKDRGCVANKPLTCRTWLCYTAQLHDREADRKLERIAARAHRLGFYVGRGDKEQSIQNAMAYFGIIKYTKWFPTLARG